MVCLKKKDTNYNKKICYNKLIFLKKKKKINIVKLIIII